MLRISDHLKLHAFFRKGATTISKESTPQESGEAHSDHRCICETFYG
jgi:hypothetical protein